MSKNKKLALGIASAVVGFTGVAGASVAVNQYSTMDDSGPKAGVSAEAEGFKLETSASGILPSLPGLSDINGVVDTATGLAGGTDVLGTATGAVATAEGVANGALATANGLMDSVDLSGVTGMIPKSCAASLPLPAALPLPANTIAAGLAQLAGVESVLNNISGLTAGLPIRFPTLLSASDVFAAARGQIQCAGALSAKSSPVPAACDIQAGLPVALPEPAAGVVKDVANMIGQNLTLGGETGAGLNCSSSGATSAVSGLASNPTGALNSVGSIVPKVAVPKVDIPALPIPELPAIPGVGAPGLPEIPDVVGTVEGVVGNLPVAVPSLPVDINGILSGVLPSSCTANASGGLLGSLTAILSASCN